MTTETVGKEKYTPVPPARTPQAVMRAYVTIRGLKPLLMSSDKEMHLGEIESPVKLIKVKGDKTDPKFEAEKRAYREHEKGWSGPLGIPAKCVQKNIEDAVKLAEYQQENKKKMRGGFSMLQRVKGSVEVEPKFIRLIHTDGSPVTDYEVNSAKVRISATKGSVIRYRPQINDWALRLEVKWNPHMYGVSAGIIEELFNKGGNLGLLDDRPHYGVYDLVEFKLDTESIKLQSEMLRANKLQKQNVGEENNNGNGKSKSRSKQ